MIHVMKDIVNTCTVACMLLVSNVDICRYIHGQVHWTSLHKFSGCCYNSRLSACERTHCLNTEHGCWKNSKEFAAPITGEWPSDTSASVEACLATWKSMQNPDSIIIFIVKSHILTSHVMILSIAICIYVYLNISIYKYLYIYIYICISELPMEHTAWPPNIISRPLPYRRAYAALSVSICTLYTFWIYYIQNIYMYYITNIS